MAAQLVARLHNQNPVAQLGRLAPPRECPYGFAIHGCMDGMCVVVGFTSVASFLSVYISSFPAKHVSCPVGSYYIQVFSQSPVASCRGDKR